MNKYKKETLEEAALNYLMQPQYFGKPSGFVEGAKWQAKRSYSEEEMKQAFNSGAELVTYSDYHGWDSGIFEEWFENFKKK